MQDRQQLLLNYIHQSRTFSPDLIKRMHDSRWLIFGGSGFVGRWLTLFGQEFSSRNELPAMVTVVSRNPQRARIRLRSFLPKKYPVPAVISIHEFLHDSDVFKKLKGVDTIFHAATPTVHGDKSLLEVVSLTSMILDKCDWLERPKFIHLSSGGVYPRDSFSGRLIPEGTGRLTVDQTTSAYQEAKVRLEQLVELATQSGKIRGANPRLFAFAGPGFPLDAPFAFSDFMRLALLNKPIEIRGNPDTCRSYMHPADMVEWLITLADRIDYIGLDPVHIGSHVPISIMDLATRISRKFGEARVQILEHGKNDAEWYVPEVTTMSNLGCTLDLSTLDVILESWRVYLAPQNLSSD